MNSSSLTKFIDCSALFLLVVYNLSFSFKILCFLDWYFVFWDIQSEDHSVFADSGLITAWILAKNALPSSEVSN
jgi:hypothetical protein